MRLLADPRVRLGLGTAAVLVTALSASRNRVGHCEARAFRAVTGLPDSLYLPRMGHHAGLGRRRRTRGSRRGALATTARSRGACSRAAREPGPCPSWSNRWCAPAPASNSGQRRTQSRPRCFRARVPVRARGYGSRPGHGCLPATEPVRARRRCRRRADRRPFPIYVGAHLPLDVAAAALGLAVDAAVALVRHPSGHKNQPDGRRSA